MAVLRQSCARVDDSGELVEGELVISGRNRVDDADRGGLTEAEVLQCSGYLCFVKHAAVVAVQLLEDLSYARFRWCQGVFVTNLHGPM